MTYTFRISCPSVTMWYVGDFISLGALAILCGRAREPTESMVLDRAAARQSGNTEHGGHVGCSVLRDLIGINHETYLTKDFKISICVSLSGWDALKTPLKDDRC